MSCHLFFTHFFGYSGTNALSSSVAGERVTLNATRDNECLIKGCVPKEYISTRSHLIS